MPSLCTQTNFQSANPKKLGDDEIFCKNIFVNFSCMKPAIIFDDTKDCMEGSGTPPPPLDLSGLYFF